MIGRELRVLSNSLRYFLSFFLFFFLSSCSWLSDDVRHKRSFVSSCHVETLCGISRSDYTVTCLWSNNMVAGFGLFTVKLMEYLPGLSVL